MANDGQIVFEVELDSKQAKADLKDVTNSIQKETKKWEKAGTEAGEKMGSSFSGMLTKIGIGAVVAKAGKALVDFGKQAVQAASDLQEVQNVVDVTFGDNANQVEKWAKNAGNQFGLTETQAKKFSSTMGAMLKSSGMAGQEIVDVSTNLAGLAADMASFYNLDFEEAFGKIRSGISGQTMPLKELGIDMSVATLEAFALQQGLTKTFSEMTQSEQTMLRYQYLMSATADAQGDFARTSDGYANSMRKLQTNVEALKSTLGSTFIDVVATAVGALNGFLEQLMPDESRRTVLDDFKDIDLKTDEKIANIQKTAEEARLLIDELDKIGGAKTSKAGSKVQQLVDDLSNINLDQEKTGILKEFISTLASNIDVISAITGQDANGVSEWLTNIGKAAENLSPDDANGWTALLNSIKEGLPGIENTTFGADFFEAMGQGVSGAASATSTLDWVLGNLGDKTNKTAQEQELWLETCRRLVQTIPGLSSIINTETGEVKGGTQAIRDYVKAWEEGRVKLAYINAHKEKGAALEEEFSDLFGLKLDADLANARLNKAYEKVRPIYEKYGKKLGLDAQGQIDISWMGDVFGGVEEEDRKAIEAFKKDIQESGLGKAFLDALEIYKARQEAYDLAKEIYAEEGEIIDGMAGDTDGLAGSTANLAREMTELEKAAEGDEDALKNVKDAVANASDAMKDLADYVESVRANIESAIDSTTKGFVFIGDASQREAKRIEPLKKELDSLDKKSKNYAKSVEEIQGRISNAQDIYGVGNLKKNLDSQLKFLQEYKSDMEKAREMGFSDEFLAQFSDGSVESAEWLHELTKANSGQIDELNKLYESVEKGKEELTGTLTEQQLSVDETYQTLAEKAKEAVAALDMEAEAAANSGKTVAGIATGIKEKLPDLKDAVDAVLNELNRLNGFGIDFHVGGSTVQIVKPGQTGGVTQHSFASGIDFVPHDMIARIHEGETILNAQEAAMYRTLEHGGIAGLDMEMLGGVMRDNVRPGGNVYLDGKQVGSVISDRQGRAYKSLQRSGWQQ